MHTVPAEAGTGPETDTAAGGGREGGCGKAGSRSVIWGEADTSDTSYGHNSKKQWRIQQRRTHRRQKRPMLKKKTPHKLYEARFFSAKHGVEAHCGKTLFEIFVSNSIIRHAAFLKLFLLSGNGFHFLTGSDKRKLQTLSPRHLSILYQRLHSPTPLRHAPATRETLRPC